MRINSNHYIHSTKLKGLTYYLLAALSLKSICSAEMLVGEIPGNISINNLGAATYSIPISNSPGTANMEPNLAINYNSNSDVNGPLGYGFSLSGLSRISRTGATKHQDGFVGGITFSSSDRFVIDGQRMIQINPNTTNYVGNGAEFRTEIDSFRKILAYETEEQSRKYFKVRTKSGLCFEYGNSPDSFVEASGRQDALYWSVNRITDTLGNYINFEYIENEGEHLIKTINYTGNTNTFLQPYNRIEFDYIDREDVRTSYIAGSQLTASKLLDQITVYAEDEYAWHYKFTYERSQTTGRSRLKSIQQLFVDDFLPKTTFNWSDNSDETVWQDSPAFIPPYKTGSRLNVFLINQTRDATIFIDVNGDGYPDTLRNHNYNWDRGASINTGTGWSPAPALVPVPIVSEPNSCDTGARFIDLNGDGLTDEIGRQGSYLSDGENWIYASGFNSPWNVTDSNGEYTGVGFPDLNGDGLPDILYHNARTNNGNTWVDAPLFNVPDWFPSKKAIAVDLNGDQLDDMIGNMDGGYNFAFINTGTTWEYCPDYFSPIHFHDINGRYTGARFSDLNGDGLMDLIQRKVDGSDSYAYLNTGSGWIEALNYIPPVPISGPFYYFEPISTTYTIGASTAELVDVNGDNLPDLIYGRPPLDTNLRTYINTGTGWSAEPSTKYTPPLPIIFGVTDSGAKILDLNGDGMVDVCSNSSNNDIDFPSQWKQRAFLNNTSKPDLLLSITAASEVRPDPNIILEYLPLTNTNVYQKGNSAEYPLVDLITPMYVVSSLAISDGLGGLTYTDYSYKGAVGHYERGFLGFEQFESYDRERQISIVKELRQDFPFTGKPQFVNKYYIPEPNADPESADYAQLLSSVTNTYLFDKVAGGTIYAYIAKSVETQWEFDMPDQPVSVTTVYNWFDDQPQGDLPTTTQPSMLSSLITDGNITKVKIDYGNGLGQTTVNEFYPADTNRWLLGRLKKTSTTHSSTDPLTTDVVKTSSFDYDPESGLLAQETIEPNHPTLMLRTDYYHDAFGNVTNETVSGAGGAGSRTVQTSAYRSNGRFLVSQSNGLNHQTTFTNDLALGVAKSITGPNNKTTTIIYDAIGRETRVNNPDGTWTSMSYEWQTNSAPIFSITDQSTNETLSFKSLYRTVAGASGGLPVTSIYDALGRPIRTVSSTPNGSTVYLNIGYNRKGQTFAISDKHFSTEAPIYSYSEYDELGRLKYSTSLDETVTEYEYKGLVTSVIIDSNHRSSGAKHQKTTTVKNSLGWTLAITNAADNVISYDYDAAGNLLETRDPYGNAIELRYNIRGNKTYQNDPDIGEWYFSYNSLGLLTSKTNANGSVVEFGYDILGRQLAKTNWLMGATLEIESISNWEYDGVDDGCWVGALRREQLKDSSGTILNRTSYAYDSFGRPMVVLRNLDNKWYYNTYRYDEFSRVKFVDRFWRPKELSSPGNERSPIWNRFTTENHYNAQGALLSVNDDSGHTWWQADENDFDSKGRLLKYSFGNGVKSSNRFNPLTGTLEEIQSGNGTATVKDIQWNEFMHDRLGNLMWRKDSKRGLREDFTYDALNRLDTATIEGSATKSMRYSAIGNIENKFGSDTYIYNGINAGPHAITSIGTKEYFYDNNGNIIRRDDNGTPEFSVNWTSFNKPRSIFNGLDGSEFTYNIDESRVTQLIFENGVVSKKKIYIESASIEQEEILLNPTETDRNLWQWTNTLTRFFVSTPTGIIGIYEEVNGESSRKYLHKDHLGSVVAITGESDIPNGIAPLLASYSFDVWGSHRNPIDWSPLSANGDPFSASSADRGYTGHEMLDHLNLVHMNGRIYDQTIGRFISADPYVQEPGNLQSYNRYSYVWNNPLSATDPSGYFMLPGIDFGSKVNAIKDCGLSLFNFQSYSYNGPDTALFAAELSTPFGTYQLGMETRPESTMNLFDAGTGNGGWMSNNNDSGTESRFHFGYQANETGVHAGANNITQAAPSAVISATVGSTSIENPKFSNGGGYWRDVGSMFQGYGDAGIAFGKGIWQLGRHPIQSAKGIGRAVMHPAQTWNAIKTDYSGRWNSGCRGKGSVIGEGLIAVLTMGAGYADDAGNLGRIGNMASKVDTALPDEFAPNGNFYSVAYEMTLSPNSYPGVSRYMHFKEANIALNNAMSSNPGLSKLGISVPKSSTGTIMGKSPVNWVWHHDKGIGVMQLVPKTQHPNIPGGIFWQTLHPGGQGGFSIWGQ